jgi:hippurate hydrolase
MGVEDFAYYAQRVPAVMFRLGLKPPADESFPGLHTSTFDFNDDALPVGIRLFVELALRWNEEAPR